MWRDILLWKENIREFMKRIRHRPVRSGGSGRTDRMMWVVQSDEGGDSRTKMDTNPDIPSSQSSPSTHLMWRGSEGLHAMIGKSAWLPEDLLSAACPQWRTAHAVHPPSMCHCCRPLHAAAAAFSLLPPPPSPCCCHHYLHAAAAALFVPPPSPPPCHRRCFLCTTPVVVSMPLPLPSLYHPRRRLLMWCTSTRNHRESGDGGL